ncbi:hypothetical protein SAMN05421751_101452 [Jhaorihella thermophila]|uniref:Uncharacterized protein n=1 Tax=Jhaorihella thermophila TaxID=488547 RepID=A0A1H5SCH7_9RHOB|nr:hypothetical protein SAMN05421751_101452 [Jhaorihella thermophila]
MGPGIQPRKRPHEVGLERLVKLDKAFLNRDTTARVMRNAPRKRLSCWR